MFRKFLCFLVQHMKSCQHFFLALLMWNPPGCKKPFGRTHFWNTKASCATFFLVPSRMPSPEMVVFFTPKNHPTTRGIKFPTRCLPWFGGSFHRYLRCWIGLMICGGIWRCVMLVLIHPNVAEFFCIFSANMVRLTRHLNYQVTPFQQKHHL